MDEGLDLIQRQQPEFINDFPTGNICIGVTQEELTELEKELKEYQEIKTYMQDYEISEIEELRRVLHNDWIIRKKFETDTAYISKALAIIKKKISDINWFKCCSSLDDYNNSVPSYRHLTQEEWDLVRKVLL